MGTTLPGSKPFGNHVFLSASCGDFPVTRKEGGQKSGDTITELESSVNPQTGKTALRGVPGIIAGCLFGAALLTKLVPAILVPLAGMMCWRGERGDGRGGSGKPGCSRLPHLYWFSVRVSRLRSLRLIMPLMAGLTCAISSNLGLPISDRPNHSSTAPQRTIPSIGASWRELEHQHSGGRGDRLRGYSNGTPCDGTRPTPWPCCGAVR